MYKAYEEYSKTLRTWFVAFGVGAPLVLLTNEKLSETLAASPLLPLLVAGYCFGVGLQVLVAIMNKNAMWACYYGENEPSFRSTRRYGLADWLSKQYWIDASVDLATAILFGWATYSAFQVVFG
jgi:tagatose-1,6-bisphosphate aldolase non-catalytic subunit AgaZ/GatZ